MKGLRPLLLGCVVLLVCVSLAATAAPAAGRTASDPVDRNAVHLIKQEALRRSRAFEIASALSDRYGARLTGSPALRAAAEYTLATLREMGLQDPRLEPWGPFGRGWTAEWFAAAVTGPGGYPLIGQARAWTPGTPGRVSGDAVLLTLGRDEDLATWKGKLRGKFLLLSPVREAGSGPASGSTGPAGHLGETQLAELAREPEPPRRTARRTVWSGPVAPGSGGEGAPLYLAPRDGAVPSSEQAFAARRMRFLLDEGVHAVLEPSSAEGGLLSAGAGGPRDPAEAPVVPQVVLVAEQYQRIARALASKRPVTLALEVSNRFHDQTTSFNVLADLPGREAPAEVVLVGAHLDSWHGGSGATDNAAGVAVVMEAARILQVVGLPLRRTVRVGLWSGEEQGALGARAYVKAHLGDPARGATLPGHALHQVYFNLDGGSGAIRGIYSQGHDAAVPLLEAWCEPLRRMGVTTVSPRGVGASDHVAFDQVGIPAFQFLQDPLDYFARAHHTGADQLERLVPEELVKNAITVATFVYHAANSGTQMPRKSRPPGPVASPKSSSVAADRLP